MKTNNKKDITLSDIAQLIRTSADETKKDLEAKIISSANETMKVLEDKIETSASGLAAMTQKQFLEMEKTQNEIKSDVKDIKANLNKKVDKIEHNTLIYRVEKLEGKAA